MTTTIALDPGLEYAVAIGRDRALVAAHFRPVLARLDLWRADEFVVEFPKFYEGGAPANKVIELAFSAGIQMGQLGCDPLNLPNRVPTVALPKDVIETRVRQALRPVELVVLERALDDTPVRFRNNVTDAVRHLLVWYRRMLP